LSLHRLCSVILLTALALVLSVRGYASVIPQNDLAKWQMTGQVGGPTEAIAVQGSYAFLGVGLRLIVIDISNPANPHQVGATTPFPYFVEGIAVLGKFAFVAAGGAGLQVVDISNPVHPTVVGAWDSAGYAEGVTVVGNIVYLADGPYGLRILDVSNPAKPTPVSFAYPTDYVFGVTVVENVAYIAAGAAGLLLLDVSNPLYPVELSAIETPGYAHHVAVNGTKAYVADGWDGIRVIDVTDTCQPQEIGHIQTPGQAFDVAISGNCAYVADAFKGVRILDISNPSQSFEIGGYSVKKGHAGQLAIVGNTVYVADRNWGLEIVDVSNPAAPLPLGDYKPFGMAYSVAVSGEYAYIAAGAFGLRVVNNSNPVLPVEVGTFATDYFVSSVAVEGHYAYVATDIGQTLYILDITNPSNIVLVGYCVRVSPGEFGAYHDIAVSGGFAYLANESGLVIIDISDPYHPEERGFIKLWEWPGGEILSQSSGVVVNGNLAYVATGKAGVKIVDVSKPANPTLVGNCRWDDTFVQDVAVSEGFAYVADAGGLTVVDISDPKKPVRLSHINTSGFTERVVFNGHTAYLSNGSTGLSMIDVSNPNSPILSGGYNTPGYAHDIVIDSGHIYVADNDGGLIILQKTSTQQTSGSLDINVGSGWQEKRLGVQLTTAKRKGSGSFYPPVVSTPNQSGDLLYKDIFKTFSRNGIVSTLDAPTTTCVVNSKADDGVGTLRNCLTNAQSGSTIYFHPAIFPPTNPQTIMLSSMLPTLNQDYLTIDASNAGVILDGSGIPSGTWGFWGLGLNVMSSNNTIKGLQIVRFPQGGISLGGIATNNQIGGDRTKGNGPLGEGNLISGNGDFGLAISPDGSENNLVIGNLIGTDITGKVAYPNRGNGISIGGYNGSIAAGNRIGGYTPGERNIISGNGIHGIGFIGSMTFGNIVLGNYIGVDISGSTALGNGDHGVGIEMGAYGNIVQENIIVTTGRNCVLISDWGGSYNTIIGNLIGTDASGTYALGGGQGAIGILGGAGYNRIGGKLPEDRNVIVGGISINRMAGIGNLIIGNFIGTNISGTVSLNGVGSGVMLDGCRYVFVGGNTSGERNVISGNSFGGIRINPGVEHAFINRNYIGLDTSGSLSIGNGQGGIILNSAEHIFVQNNAIAYHTYPNPGIQITTTGFNTIRHNSIYSNAAGIQNSDGGNNMLFPPVIKLTNTGLTGTACPGCTVEFFLDSEDEGRAYIGNSIADASGTFSHSAVCPVPYPNLTATATDFYGNTSQFSSPQPVNWNCTSPNPVPALASLNPTSITAVSPTFLLTATGINFIPNSRIRWNSIDLPTTFINNTHLTAVIPSGFITLTGIANIIVYNPEPGGGISNAITFTLLPPIGTHTNCTATLYTNMSLHIPILTCNGTAFWADLSYVPNTMDFILTNYGVLSDTSSFNGCAPSSLSADLKLHIPMCSVGDTSYWADLQYAHDLIFTLTGAGQY